MFSQRLRTPAPITGVQNTGPASEFEDPVSHVVEDWIHEQTRDPDFIKSLEWIEDGLYLYAPDGQAPKILVLKVAREPLIRFTHARMFHLGYTKVTERLTKIYLWSCV